MVKTSDLIAEFLKEKKIDTVFGIIGSANSHIFDSINKLGYTKIICTHHEQAAVMAMGAYFRASGKISAALVTAGGGATNCVTGIVSNWADSIPGIIISGQESSNYVRDNSNLRMYGTQGLNIVKMLSSVTKYGVCIDENSEIQNELELAYNISIGGRPGPTIIDIPFNLQSKLVCKRKWRETLNLKFFVCKDDLDNLINLINKSKNPLIVGGNGIRLSGANKEFKKFVNKTKIPTTLTWSGIDLLDNNNSNFYGRFGLYGQRCANFIVQNTDLIIVLGSRLALPQVGYDINQFAKNTKIIIVDIDENESLKYQHKINKWIKADCKNFLQEINLRLNEIKPNIIEWKQYCNNLKEKYPWVDEEHKDGGKEYLNSYKFIDRISNYLKDNHIIVTDMGTALLSGHQAIKLKSNQKMFTSLGLGEMGYGLPGAIGAAFACPDKPILCLNCDGGIMMNLQELHTIIEHKLPIKIVIFNNDGYLMIKHTQKMLFKGDYTSVDKKTGVGLPNFSKLMPAFGFEYFRLNKWEDFDNIVSMFLNDEKASVLEVFMNPEQDFIPKVKGVLKEDGSIFPPPIEEMSPLLPFEEIEKNMITGVNKKSKQIKR